MENYAKFLNYYAKGRKLKMSGFFALSLIAGFMEFLGIALVYPFVMLITNPANVIHKPYYQTITSFTHSQDSTINALIIGFAIAIIFIVKNLFMIFVLIVQSSFITNWKNDICTKFLKNYLFSSYKDSVKIPTSEKLFVLQGLVSSALSNFIFRGITFITNSIIIISILALLLVKFPFATICTSIFIAITLFIQNSIFKKLATRISKRLAKNWPIYNQKALECTTNLKEIKILSKEDFFLNSFKQAQKDYYNTLKKQEIITQTPPFAVEIIVVLSIIFIGGIIALQNLQNNSAIIVSFAIIIAAIFRIAPLLHRVQISLNSMNSSRELIKRLNTEYENNKLNHIQDFNREKIEFVNKITLSNINFSYTKNIQVIKDLNLEIKKGEFIGIIGSSGAGKTTLADIIMGLLPIDTGEIKVDEKIITSNDLASLRALIGYVPQEINVFDKTIKENVAFGDDLSEIDEQRVNLALEKAQLIDFIKTHKEGINSKIITDNQGLSQGQKQRLAIARALYRESEILIFDEATSALDVQTEHEITQMLNGLKSEKTIIAIAHRLSTLKACDRLVYLKDGHVVDTGSFEELSNKHADFENLIRLSNIT